MGATEEDNGHCPLVYTCCKYHWVGVAPLRPYTSDINKRHKTFYIYNKLKSTRAGQISTLYAVLSASLSITLRYLCHVLPVLFLLWQAKPQGQHSWSIYTIATSFSSFPPSLSCWSLPEAPSPDPKTHLHLFSPATGYRKESNQG